MTPLRRRAESFLLGSLCVMQVVVLALLLLRQDALSPAQITVAVTYILVAAAYLIWVTRRRWKRHE